MLAWSDRRPSGIGKMTAVPVSITICRPERGLVKLELDAGSVLLTPADCRHLARILDERARQSEAGD